MKILILKNYFSLILLVVLLASLMACGGTFSRSDQRENLIGALVIDGAINDKSFNEGSWKGLLKAQKDLGYQVIFRENKQASEYPAAISSLMEIHPAIIFGVGYKLEEETRRQAKENLGVFFASIDGVSPIHPSENLLVVSFSVEQASFLAGFVAANMTQTGKVGFLGGIEGEIIGLFDYGFEAGVRYARPEVQIINQYAESFFDVSKGRNIADLMLQKGVDIIFHAAGPTGNGMIEVIREKQLENKKVGNGRYLWAIGVDVDEYEMAPEVVLTSVVKRVDNAVYMVADEVKKGQFKGGRHIILGLEGDFVSLSETSSIHIPAQLLAEVEILKESIVKGNIQVPKTKAELEAYKIKLEASIL